MIASSRCNKLAQQIRTEMHSPPLFEVMSVLTIARSSGAEAVANVKARAWRKRKPTKIIATAPLRAAAGSLTIILNLPFVSLNTFRFYPTDSFEGSAAAQKDGRFLTRES